MATMGRLSLTAPVEPKKRASPKPKTPPSEAVSQYPAPEVVGATPTIGWLSRRPPVEPRNGALPRAKTPPSAPTSQAPGAWRPATVAAAVAPVSGGSAIEADIPRALASVVVAATRPVRRRL